MTPSPGREKDWLARADPPAQQTPRHRAEPCAKLSVIQVVNMSDNVAFVQENNKGYQSGFKHGDKKSPPARKLAIVTCMDARMHPETAFGLEVGDAHVIRNAGGRIDLGALRSLVISQRLLGTREVWVIHHTGCGMATFENADLYGVVEKDLGGDARKHAEKIDFLTFKGLEDSVREDVQIVKNHALLQDVPTHGFVYDVKTGALNPVS